MSAPGGSSQHARPLSGMVASVANATRPSTLAITRRVTSGPKSTCQRLSGLWPTETLTSRNHLALCEQGIELLVALVYPDLHPARDDPVAGRKVLHDRKADRSGPAVPKVLERHGL